MGVTNDRTTSGGRGCVSGRRCRLFRFQQCRLRGPEGFAWHISLIEVLGAAKQENAEKEIGDRVDKNRNDASFCGAGII